MKMNLPSTWTSKKITGLLLTAWLATNKVKAGQTLKDCLAYNNDTTSYDLLLDYPFANNSNLVHNLWIHLCCDQSKCLLIGTNANKCTQLNNTKFDCNKIAQTIFCNGFSGRCGGTIGNNTITNDTTVGTCPSTGQVANNLVNVTIDHGFATNYCTNTANACLNYPGGFYCFQDNDGWICFGNAANYNTICFLQLSDSLHIPITSFSSLLSTTISSTIFLTSSSPTSISDSPINFNLIPIVVSVGTVIGIVSAGGLVYYLYKKRKKSHQEKEQVEGIDRSTNFESRNDSPLKNQQETSPKVFEGEETFEKPNEYIEQLEVFDSQKLK